MRWTGKLAAVCTLALLALPTAYTFQQQEVVTGHTTYASMDGLDPCVAGIAGIVRLRVMWFNDQVLFERAPTDGGAWVYAVEGGAPDPREALLRPTGEAFEFTDPNGMTWVVREYTYPGEPVEVSQGNVTVNRSPSASGTTVDGGNYTVTPPSASPGPGGSWYAWVVQTGPVVEDFAATGRPYNFVDLVDTCKFTSPSSGVQHANSGGNWSSSWPQDTTQGQHLADDPSHAHDRFSVDLYVGKAPVTEDPGGVVP